MNRMQLIHYGITRLLLTATLARTIKQKDILRNICQEGKYNKNIYIGAPNEAMAVAKLLLFLLSMRNMGIIFILNPDK